MENNRQTIRIIYLMKIFFQNDIFKQTKIKGIHHY